MSKTFLSIFFISFIHVTFSLNNGLGLTPPMGFNTWNHFACNINETVLREAADLIIELGLNKIGYQYINIDDCWMTDKRNEKGELVVDPKRFPRGMNALSDYVHQLGLKLGIYSSAGFKTCQRLPASLDHEDIDARSWAKWGIDYLKYDNCFHDARAAKERYTRMRDALNSTGRPIFYSICDWGEEKLYEIGKTLGNSWRTTYDISNNFDSVRSIFRQNSDLAKHAGIGGWNDPDMLEVGNGKLTIQEDRTHFALWAIVKSPLLLGCDLTKISKEQLAIISNKEIIDINQDKLGIQAECALNCNTADSQGSAKRAQIFTGLLDKSNYVLTVTNWNDKETFTNIKINFKELELPRAKYMVRNLWKHENVGVFEDGFSIEKIESHDTSIFKLIKQD